MKYKIEATDKKTGAKWTYAIKEDEKAADDFIEYEEQRNPLVFLTKQDMSLDIEFQNAVNKQALDLNWPSKDEILDALFSEKFGDETKIIELVAKVNALKTKYPITE